MRASTFTDPKPRGVPKACARISSDCSSGTVMKYQRPAASPFQTHSSEVTVITSARQFPVRHSVRACGFLAQAADLVLLIGFEVALEPGDFAIAFERQDMRRQPVEKEAI